VATAALTRPLWTFIITPSKKVILYRIISDQRPRLSIFSSVRIRIGFLIPDKKIGFPATGEHCSVGAGNFNSEFEVAPSHEESIGTIILPSSRSLCSFGVNPEVGDPLFWNADWFNPLKGPNCGARGAEK
jgi:hypothetical protein